MKIIITTSGTGSRLFSDTKFRNKSLVRIGNKPVISHIIDNYPPNTEFVITLGHYGKQVKDFLLLSYPDKVFEFVEIDKYKGEGSSLGYSLLCAKNKLNCPFIFHACDTLIFEKIPDVNNNWCGVFSKTKVSNKSYRKIIIDNNRIISFKDKYAGDYDYEYIGLCKIYDYKAFWRNLKDLYNNNKNNKCLSDCDVIQRMIKFNITFNYHVFDTWKDTGNVDSLKKVKKTVKSSYNILDKNTEDIYFVNGYVIKFFSDSNIVKNRVYRAKNQLKNITPSIVSFNDNFYKYKFSEGELISKIHNLNLIKELLEWSENNLWDRDVNISDAKFDILCKNFYIDKTKARVNKFLEKYSLKDEETIINGIKVKPFSSLIQEVRVQNHIKTIFHGDFIYDNIIKTSEEFILLDWRQDFAGEVNCGDIYYDLSKLYHNFIVNHEIVVNKNFSVKKINENIEIDIHCKNSLLMQKQMFEDIIKQKYDLNKVKLVTSLIWLNMSPLHDEVFGKFLYYFGKLNLHLILEKLRINNRK